VQNGIFGGQDGVCDWLTDRPNATPNVKRFGMSFEAPLGLSTSNHPYAIKVNIVCNNKPKRAKEVRGYNIQIELRKMFKIIGLAS